MNKLKCDICSACFATKSNLLKHKKTAKYCKIINTRECELCHCFINIDELYNHNFNCIIYLKNKIFELEKNNKELEIYTYKNKELETQYQEIKQQNEELKQQNRDLHEQLKDFTLKLLDKPNNITTTNNYSNSGNTTNNTKVDIFNNLKPLTDDDFKSNIDNLTIEHVKKGAEGYAEYSLEYPLKDKLLCLDLSRKKICYKDENGNRIEEYKLDKLLKRLFENIDKKNYELINQIIQEIQTESNEYYKSTSSVDENTQAYRLFSDKLDSYHDLQSKYMDIFSDSKKMYCGNMNNNPLYDRIVEFIIKNIPKNK